MVDWKICTIKVGIRFTIRFGVEKLRRFFYSTCFFCVWYLIQENSNLFFFFVSIITFYSRSNLHRLRNERKKTSTEERKQAKTSQKCRNCEIIAWCLFIRWRYYFYFCSFRLVLQTTLFLSHFQLLFDAISSFFPICQFILYYANITEICFFIIFI